MIVTIFGIPRSGKTTLVNKLETTPELKAVSLRKKVFLEKYAISLMGKQIWELSMAEVDSLVGNIEKELHDYEKEHDFVVLDSHVGYLVGKEWVEIRPERYHQIGDVFIYLNTSVDIILERMNKTQGVKAIYDYTLEDLVFYQQRELQRLDEILALKNKKSFVLNNSDGYYREVVSYLNSLKGAL